MSALKTSLVAFAFVPLAAACAPSVPEHPTWADVEPILRGNCTHCHGASAARDAHSDSEVYRFDFFEVSVDRCGLAASALDAPRMAHGYAPLIAAAITPSADGRARMPPLPAPALSDWERETLLRWLADPVLGEAPRDNRRPQISISGEPACCVDDRLELTVFVDDPDGEPVVGVLELGDQTLAIDGPGAFQVSVDTSSWETGRYPAIVSLCDGWDLTCYELPEIVVVH